MEGVICWPSASVLEADFSFNETIPNVRSVSCLHVVESFVMFM
jgi:hypothetical protein